MTPHRPRVPLSDCRDCGDPILFVKMPTGRVIPVNPAPGPDGNVAAELIGSRLHGYVISAARPPAPRLLRYRAHAATCGSRPRKPPPPPEPTLF